MRVRYDDRHQAGQVLARELGEFVDDPTVVVVALPRGGVPVAFEVARALNAPLEVLAVHKLGAPFNPEFAIGAVAEDGTAVVDEEHARACGLSATDLDYRIKREAASLAARSQAFRDDMPPLALRGATVLLVDDGVATGLTNLAAIRSVRRHDPIKIVLAIPVAAAGSLPRLAAEADQVICARIPEELISVGSWYRDFSQVTDDQVRKLFQQA